MKCVVQRSVNTLVKVLAIDCGRSVRGLQIICLQSSLSLKLTLLCVKLQLGPSRCWENPEVQRVLTTRQEGVLRLLHRQVECGLKYSCMVLLTVPCLPRLIYFGKLWVGELLWHPNYPELQDADVLRATSTSSSQVSITSHPNSSSLAGKSRM